MPTPDRLKAALAAAARAYLDHADGPSADPFEVRVLRDGAEHRLHVSGAAGESGLTPVEAALLAYLLSHFLSPTELLILRTLEAGPQAPDALRHRLERGGHPVGRTKLDLTLAELVRRGLVEVGEAGHALAGDPVRDVLRRLTP